MQKRILIAVGGTGGHIFPALALAESLADKCAILFAGGNLSINPFFAKENFAFREVACGQLKRSPIAIVRESGRLIKGIFDSLRIIQDFKPQIVLGFGSYHTLPVLLAAKLLRIPIYLHEANSIPGRVNRLLAPCAENTWVQFPSAQKLLKGPSSIGPIPLRRNFRKNAVTTAEARKAFQLHPDRLTLLIFGGSQGAKRINQLVSTAVLFHLKEMLPPFQILHFTGNHMEAEQLMERYVSAEIAAYVRPFENRMDLAWAAADLSVTRAGAVSIAEQMEYEVPGVLIPYPHAMDNHQEMNADFVVDIGLGFKLEEKELTPQRLAEKIQELYAQVLKSIQKFRDYKMKSEVPALAEQVLAILQNKNE